MKYDCFKFFVVLDFWLKYSGLRNLIRKNWNKWYIVWKIELIGIKIFLLFLEINKILLLVY